MVLTMNIIIVKEITQEHQCHWHILVTTNIYIHVETNTFTTNLLKRTSSDNYILIF